MSAEAHVHYTVRVLAPKGSLGVLVLAVLAVAGTGEAQRAAAAVSCRQFRVATAADFDGASTSAASGSAAVAATAAAGASITRRPTSTSRSASRSSPRRPSASTTAREPNHLVVRLTDDALFQCPFVMMTEVGALYLDEEEVERLREYLLKGGFLWADDFWGSYAWQVWESEIRKVLPAGQYPIVDLPLDHPLFRTQFVVTKVPQIPSINFWMGSGGGTSERGYDSQTPTARAILDATGRPMVLMTHNTDLGDSWEREGDDPNYFYAFAVDGYAFGINVVLYSMMH